MELKAEFPPERWFWVHLPIHRAKWRCCIDSDDVAHRFPAGRGCRPEEEKRTRARDCANPRDARRPRPFELEGVSVYTFQCRRWTASCTAASSSPAMLRTRCRPSAMRCEQRPPGHGQPRPGSWARRAGSPASLLDSYDRERRRGRRREHPELDARDDFITSKTPVSRIFRDAVRCFRNATLLRGGWSRGRR